MQNELQRDLRARSPLGVVDSEAVCVVVVQKARQLLDPDGVFGPTCEFLVHKRQPTKEEQLK